MKQRLEFFAAGTDIKVFFEDEDFAYPCTFVSFEVGGIVVESESGLLEFFPYASIVSMRECAEDE